MRRQVQIVFQDALSSLNPRMTVGTNIGEPMRLQGHRHGARAAGRHRCADRPRRAAARARTATYPHEFSGGQCQRIAIARALILRPSAIVFDEAVSALDVSIRAQILRLILDLQQRFGLGYLFISHDLSVVKRIADRIAVMYLGRIVEIGPSDAVYRAPLQPVHAGAARGHSGARPSPHARLGAGCPSRARRRARWMRATSARSGAAARIAWPSATRRRLPGGGGQRGFASRLFSALARGLNSSLTVVGRVSGKANNTTRSAPPPATLSARKATGRPKWSAIQPASVVLKVAPRLAANPKEPMGKIEVAGFPGEVRRGQRNHDADDDRADAIQHLDPDQGNDARQGCQPAAAQQRQRREADQENGLPPPALGRPPDPGREEHDDDLECHDGAGGRPAPACSWRAARALSATGRHRRIGKREH